MGSARPVLKTFDTGATMKTLNLWTALILSAFALSSNAADCASAKTQLEINDCAAFEFKNADKKLNTVYSAYLTRLDTQQKKQLKDAQRAWIKFRDLSCEFESSGVDGGSAYPMVLQNCLTAKTRARIDDLVKLGQCRERDLSCPAPK